MLCVQNTLAFTHIDYYEWVSLNKLIRVDYIFRDETYTFVREWRELTAGHGRLK